MRNNSIPNKVKRAFFPDNLVLRPHQSLIHDRCLWAFRIFCAIYLTCISIWRFTTFITVLDQIIYLTCIGFRITWLYFVLIVQHRLFLKFMPKNSPFYLQILYEIAASLELPITILYWGFVYEPGLPTEQFVISLNVHVLPFVLVLVELVMNSFPFVRIHFLVILVLGVMYSILNIVYSLKIKAIYPVLDWKSWFSFFLAVLAYLVAFLMFSLCGWVYQKWKKKKLEATGGQKFIEELPIEE